MGRFTRLLSLAEGLEARGLYVPALTLADLLRSAALWGRTDALDALLALVEVSTPRPCSLQRIPCREGW
jgi:hypothetical protein